MFVCGFDRWIYAVRSSAPGSQHDSRVFKESEVYAIMEAGYMDELPLDQPLMLGDSAYPVKYT